MTNYNTKRSSIKSIIFSGLLAFSFMGSDNALCANSVTKILDHYSDTKNFNKDLETLKGDIADILNTKIKQYNSKEITLFEILMTRGMFDKLEIERAFDSANYSITTSQKYNNNGNLFNSVIFNGYSTSLKFGTVYSGGPYGVSAEINIYSGRVEDGRIKSKVHYTITKNSDGKFSIKKSI